MRSSIRTSFVFFVARMFCPLPLLVACHDDGGTVDKGKQTDNKSTVELPKVPPEPITESVRCIVSADCPTGSHCDLGECVQDCNTDKPCDDADLSCSQRARCVTTQAEDVDPTPSADFHGTVTANTDVSVLSESDTSLPITLTSDGDEPVKYRVSVNGAHLSIDEPRGEFTGTREITVKVDGSNFSAQDVPGTVQIYTNLGELLVPANLHAGLSGFYRGALSYSDGHIRLGEARIRIALSENKGGIVAWVDPDSSLLFPEDAALEMPAATGSGSLSGETLTFTISQRIPKAYGGERNHLGRDIGRQLTFTLKPTTGGGWKGSFEERITGLFVQPVVDTGSVILAYESRDGLTPADTKTTFQSVTLSANDLTRALPNWNDGDCVTTLQNSGVCSGLIWSTATENARASCLGNTLYTAEVKPLYDSVGGTEPVPYHTLADECGQQLTASSIKDISAVAAQHCGIVPLIECGVQLAAQSDVTNNNTGRALNQLVDGAINPVLLVTQERIIAALNLSISGSSTVTEERAAYDKAAAALNRAVSWVYQPSVLEGLHKLSPTIAASTTSETTAPYTTYPAARAISKLLRTVRDLEAERTRLNAIEHLDVLVDRKKAAQSSALSAFIEGIALNELFDTWGNVPSTVGAEVSGLLGPFDSSFGAALQGIGIFGVPDSYVPFVYDSNDATKGKNNFTQMLAVANEQLGIYADLETTYTTSRDATVAADYTLAEQALQLQTQYDRRVVQLCGDDFNIDTAQISGNVSSCGKTNGEAARLRLRVESSNLGLQGALGQLSGMQDKLAIELRLMQEKYKLHEENLNFLDAQGKSIDANIWAEGIINAEQVALATAAQGNLANLFSGVALAVPMAVLELEKTALAAARQDLQTAQQMHFERQTQIAEELEAQANIEKELVDFAQYHVQIRQATLDQTAAQLELSNSLSEAQRLLEERATAQRVASLNPAKDPAYRLIRDDAAIKMLSARSRAQKYLFLAGRALEYELNESIPDIMKAALVSRSAARMRTLKNCLAAIPAGISSPQSYTRKVSVRQMLGITGVRKDECTGEELSEALQFQRVLLQNGNLDGDGGVTLRFATDLLPGNNLWGTNVCNDRITAIRAQLVGDFLGDDDAALELALAGTAIMRDCTGSNLVTWSLGGDLIENLGTAVAVVQAGVNDFGKAAPNTSLYGQSVARAQWLLTIPGSKAAPTNSDVNLTKIEDIILEVTHEARPISPNTSYHADFTCLEQVL